MKNTPPFLRAGIAGMAVATTMIGLAYPPLAISALISLAISGVILVTGYHGGRCLCRNHG